jgi:hypothetical protein
LKRRVAMVLPRAIHSAFANAVNASGGPAHIVPAAIQKAVTSASATR